MIIRSFSIWESKEIVIKFCTFKGRKRRKSEKGRSMNMRNVTSQSGNWTRTKETRHDDESRFNERASNPAFLTPTPHLIYPIFSFSSFLLRFTDRAVPLFFPQSKRDKDVKRQLTGHGVVTVLALRNFNSWARFIHWSLEPSYLGYVIIYLVTGYRFGKH